MQHTLHGKVRGAYQLSHLSQMPSKAALKSSEKSELQAEDVVAITADVTIKTWIIHKLSFIDTLPAPLGFSATTALNNLVLYVCTVCVRVKKTLQLVLRIQTNLSQSQLWSWESPSIYLSLLSSDQTLNLKDHFAWKILHHNSCLISHHVLFVLLTSVFEVLIVDHHTP